MSLLEQFNEDLKNREFTDTTASISLEDEGDASLRRPPLVHVNLNDFHNYHIELMKRYGIKFEAKRLGYVGNLWIVLDLVLPKLNIPDKNVIIDKRVPRVRQEWEAALIPKRPPSKEKVCYAEPLEGKPPHENFQVDTIKQAIMHDHYGIFLKQGTGKSYIIASILRYLFQTDEIDFALICTPGTGLIDIKRKIIQFASDEFSEEDFAIITKDNRDCFQDGKPVAKVLIMTYSTLRLVAAHYTTKTITFKRRLPKMIKNAPRFAAVLDEGHNIGNNSSKQTSAAQALETHAKYRYLSTGTPADKPDKYYTLLRFIHPYLVRYLSYSAWIKCVANLGTSFSEFQVSDFRPEDLRYFLNIADEWLTNLQDDDVLELPPHYKKMVPVDIDSTKHRNIYEGFLNYQLAQLKVDSGALYPRQVLNRFPYLLLALDNPEILQQHETTWYVSDPEDPWHTDSEKLDKLLKRFKFQDHSKLPYLKELIEEHAVDKREKVVIWTGHPLTADQLAQIPWIASHHPLVIHGNSKKKGVGRDELKDQVVQQFIKTEKHRILIASYLVLDTALDITEATTQIYFDMPYALINFDQSSKRLHRAGQEKPVTSYYLVFANTIDETRYTIVHHKKQLDTKALDSTMPLEEWKQLFSGVIPDQLEASIEEAQLLF